METKSTHLILRIAISDRSMLPMPVDEKRRKIEKIAAVKEQNLYKVYWSRIRRLG